jgi:hypothetical protein
LGKSDFSSWTCLTLKSYLREQNFLDPDRNDVILIYEIIVYKLFY